MKKCLLFLLCTAGMVHWTHLKQRAFHCLAIVTVLWINKISRASSLFVDYFIFNYYNHRMLIDCDQFICVIFFSGWYIFSDGLVCGISHVCVAETAEDDNRGPPTSTWSTSNMIFFILSHFLRSLRSSSFDRYGSRSTPRCMMIYTQRGSEAWARQLT